jgi:ABC-type dipeptide/oligopeptide/nickel transport system permease component
MVLAFFVVELVAYTILTCAPGDVAQVLVGEHASREQVEALRQTLQLDTPFIQRLGGYTLGALTRGDLGKSLVSGRFVADLIIERLPNTLMLAILSMVVGAVVGIVAGVMAAERQGGPLDALIRGGSVLGLAVPSYWVALVLVQVFAVKLRWLPVFGAGGCAHFVLPVLTLALPCVAIVARLIRAGILDARGADYVRTAVGKGLSGRVVLFRHMLPNCLVPTITVLGLYLGHLVGGAFVIETIYAWPGVGRLAVQAILDRDIPVVMGTILVVVPMILVINLIVDLVLGKADARVRDVVI